MAPGPDDGDMDEPQVPLVAQLAIQEEKYLRLAAEYDNYRKRSLKEKTGLEKKGQVKIVSGLVETFDDLLRFAQLDANTATKESLAEGMEMVAKKLFKNMQENGLELIRPMGSNFDPMKHEAVAIEPTDIKEEDHRVAKVFQPGYIFDGALLRPARVVVKQYTPPASAMDDSIG